MHRINAPQLCTQLAQETQLPGVLRAPQCSSLRQHERTPAHIVLTVRSGACYLLTCCRLRCHPKRSWVCNQTFNQVAKGIVPRAREHKSYIHKNTQQSLKAPAGSGAARECSRQVLRHCYTLCTMAGRHKAPARGALAGAPLTTRVQTRCRQRAAACERFICRSRAQASRRMPSAPLLLRPESTTRRLPALATPGPTTS